MIEPEPEPEPEPEKVTTRTARASSRLKKRKIVLKDQDVNWSLELLRLGWQLKP